MSFQKINYKRKEGQKVKTHFLLCNPVLYVIPLLELEGNFIEQPFYLLLSSLLLVTSRNCQV